MYGQGQLWGLKEKGWAMGWRRGWELGNALMGTDFGTAVEHQMPLLLLETPG